MNDENRDAIHPKQNTPDDKQPAEPAGSAVKSPGNLEKLEDELTRERNLLRTLLDHLPDYIYIKDELGRHLVNNRANLTLLGAVTEEETVGKTVFDYFPENLAREYFADDQTVLRSGKPIVNRAENSVDHEGHLRWLLTTKLPLRDAQQKIIGLVGISRDITDWRDAEESRNRLSQQMELLLQSTGEGIFGIDMLGCCTFINRAGAELLQWPVRELLGKNMQSLITHSLPDTIPVPEVESPIHAALSRGEKGRVENDFFWRRDGTTFATSYSSFPILENGKIIGAVVVFSDVTERRQLEAQLRQSQKMEAFGQLAGGVAHDFNNILGVILGYAEILIADEGLEPKFKEKVRQIFSAGERAANLTRQLLTFSHQKPLEIVSLDLNEIISNTVRMLGRIIGEDIQVHCFLSPKPATMRADQGMIEQVLLNLVVNARDAMPAGGDLTIEAAVVTVAEDQAQCLPEAWPGVFVRLTVRDVGCGMPPEVMKRIFEPFYTTKPVGKGTGLGMATIYGIMRQHQGWVEVESQVGVGSSFRAYFPFCQSPESQTEDKKTTPSQTKGHEGILLVEDEPALRKLARIVLQSHGYKILEAGSGIEALALWADRKNEVDLLLTDLVMPHGITGKELAKQLQQEKPSLKIIYASGYSQDIEVQTSRLGESIFLQKAVRTPEIASSGQGHARTEANPAGLSKHLTWTV